MAKGIFSSLKGIDAFGKTMEDVKVKTRTGALLTILSVAIILTFTTIEFFDYRRITTETSVVVDKSRGERLTVNLNVSFPKIPCYLLSLDVMDISGERQADITHNILKTRLDAQRRPLKDQATTFGLQNEVEKAVEARGPDYCGSCYGGLEPDGACCNTCESVRQAYVNRGWSFGDPDAIEQCRNEGWTEKIKAQASEGCLIEGRVRVNKVVGSLQFSFGKSFQANAMSLHELVPYLRDDNQHDWRHRIVALSFTSDDEFNVYKAELSKDMKRRLNIAGNPLDGSYGHTESTEYMFQYFLKVVSTQFRTIRGDIINTHQYSATHFDRDLQEGARGKTEDGVQLTHGAQGMPGVFFNFEISPMRIIHAESRQSFAHFITSTCAIVGGVLTIASILDSVLFASTKALKRTVGGSGNGHNAYGGKLM